MSFSDKKWIKCDSMMHKDWYRFTGAAGSEMPQSCVPTYHCGTHAPGWLNGEHPTVADGIVTREVCYHWSNNCCRWKNNIRIRNCGKFYVYELVKPPACSLRYCGTSGGLGECWHFAALSSLLASAELSKVSPCTCTCRLVDPLCYYTGTRI